MKMNVSASSFKTRGILFCIALMVGCACAQAGVGGNEKQSLAMVMVLTKLFKDAGSCSSIHECRKLEKFFVSRSPNGISVTVYQVNDARLVTEVILTCLEFSTRNSGLGIQLEVFEVSRKAASGFAGLFSDPIVELLIKERSK